MSPLSPGEGRVAWHCGAAVLQDVFCWCSSTFYIVFTHLEGFGSKSPDICSNTF